MVLLLAWFTIAHADEPPASQPTIVTGRVTDVLGRAVPDARVYVIPRSGQPVRAKTDTEGRYRATVSTPGTYGVVVVLGRAQTYRTVEVIQGVTNTLDVEAEVDVKGGEVVRIEGRPVPKVKPRSKQDVQQTLPYTDEAVARDAWARAWLLLDVDESGRVTRLKLLKKPGFGLEKICLEAAFELRFEPARDDGGRAMKTYMLWSMEWPSWGWLVKGNGTALRRPPDEREVHVHAQNQLVEGMQDGAKIGGAWSSPLPVTPSFQQALSRVPCWGTAPLNLDLQNRAYRDCAKPDMKLARTLPWITRATVATALVELSAPVPIIGYKPQQSRVLGWIGIGTTSAFAVATVLSFARYDDYHSRLVKAGMLFTGELDPEQIKSNEDRRDRWKKIAIGMSAATILVGGATLFLWNRHEPNFSIAPSASGTGATASYTRSW